MQERVASNRRSCRRQPTMPEQQNLIEHQSALRGVVQSRGRLADRLANGFSGDHYTLAQVKRGISI